MTASSGQMIAEPFSNRSPVNFVSDEPNLISPTAKIPNGLTPPASPVAGLLVAPPRSSSSPLLSQQRATTLFSPLSSSSSSVLLSSPPSASLNNINNSVNSQYSNVNSNRQQRSNRSSIISSLASKSTPSTPIMKLDGNSSECATSTVLTCGYLWKQGFSLKLWKRRYFSLQDGQIFYFESQEDAERGDAVPVGAICLDNLRGVWRCEQDSKQPKFPFIFRIETADRKWLLASHDNDTVEEWIQALRGILQENKLVTGERVEHAPALMKGWLEKHSKGSVRKRWFELKYNMLYCYREESKELMKMIPLKDCLLEIAFSPTDDDSDGEQRKIKNITFDLIPGHNHENSPNFHGRFGLHLISGVIWLKCFNVEEYENWVNILMEILDLHPSSESSTERAVSDVLQCLPTISSDNDEILNSIAQNLVDTRVTLHHSAEQQREPQTTLASARLYREACRIAKACRTLTEDGPSDPRDDPSGHIGIIQGMIRRCLRERCLQNELIVQLIRYTTRHCEPDGLAHLRSWQVLSICMTVFLPSRKVLTYLRTHIKLSKSMFRTNTLRAYVLYCERILNQEPFARKQVPSMMEIKFICSLHKSCQKDMSIPIHSINGCVIAVTFSPHTKVGQTMEVLVNALGLQNSQIIQPGLFVLYAYLVSPNPDPGSYTVHNIPVDSEFYLADLVYKHEKQVSEFASINTEFPSFLGMNIDNLFLELRLHFLLPLSPNINKASTVAQNCTSRPVTPVNIQPGGYSVAILTELRQPFTLEQVQISKGPLVETKSVSVQRWRLLSQYATKGEKDFIFRQMNDLIMRNKYPIALEAALKMAALQAQASWGDHYPLLDSDESCRLKECLRAFVPPALIKASTQAINPATPVKKTARKPRLNRIWKIMWPLHHSKKSLSNQSGHERQERVEKALCDRISQNWIQIRGFSQEHCVDTYLENSFLWPWALWSCMFPAQVECPEMAAKLRKQKFFFCACSDAIGVLDYETKNPICVFEYSQIISGGISGKHTIFLILEPSEENDLLFSGKRSGAVRMEITIFTVKAADMLEWINSFIAAK